MAKMTKSELQRFLEQNQKDTSYLDYIRSGVDNLFDVEEDDGFLERFSKGAGSLFVGSPLMTGAVAEGLLTGEIDPSELGMEDFLNLVYSVPALKGLASSPKIAKEAFRVFKTGGKNGFKKAVDFVGEKLGPSKAFVGPNKPGVSRTSKGQLADMVGLGKSPAGKTKLGGAANRLGRVAGAGFVADGLLDRSSRPQSSDNYDNDDNDDNYNDEPKLDLDNPSTNGQTPTDTQTSTGSASSAINAANEMQGSGRYDPLGDFSKDILKNTVVGEALRRTENEIAANKKSDRLAAEEAHRASVRAESPEYAQIESLYDSTGGRKKGAFAKLSQQQRDDAFRQFNLNRSAANNKRARIQSILDDEDRKHIAAGKPGPLPSDEFMFANEENSFFNDGSVSKKAFSEKTGLKRPGTGVMRHEDGTFSPREFDGAFERAGGFESAEAFLEGVDPSGEKLASLQHQLNGDRAYRYDGSSDARGLDMGLDVGEGNVVFGADKSAYPRSNFDSYEEAVAYLNRPSLDNPSAAPAAPSAPSEDEDSSLFDYLPYAPLALPLLTRGKVKPKAKASYRGPTSLAKPAPEYVNAIPIPRPNPNYVSKTPALPNRPAGLPNSSNPSAPKVLGNRLATQEQFRRAQEGMDTSSSAIAKRARRDYAQDLNRDYRENVFPYRNAPKWDPLSGTYR